MKRFVWLSLLSLGLAFHPQDALAGDHSSGITSFFHRTPKDQSAEIRQMQAKADALYRSHYAMWKPWGIGRFTGSYVVQIRDVSIPLAINPAKGVVPMITVEVHDPGYENRSYQKKVPITEVSYPLTEYKDRFGLKEGDRVLWTNNGKPREGIVELLTDKRAIVGLADQFQGYSDAVAAPYNQVEKVSTEMQGHKAGDFVRFGKQAGKITEISKSYVKVGYSHNEQVWDYPLDAKPRKTYGFQYLPETGQPVEGGIWDWGLTEHYAPPSKAWIHVDEYDEKWVPRDQTFTD